MARNTPALGGALRDCPQHKIRKTLLRCLLQVADSATFNQAVETFGKQMIVEDVSLDARIKPRRCQNQRARPVPRPDRADAWRTAHSEWAAPLEANSQGELDNSRAGAET